MAKIIFIRCGVGLTLFSLLVFKWTGSWGWIVVSEIIALVISVALAFVGLLLDQYLREGDPTVTLYGEVRLGGWLLSIGYVTSALISIFSPEIQGLFWQPLVVYGIVGLLMIIFSVLIRIGKFNVPVFISAFGVTLCFVAIAAICQCWQLALVLAGTGFIAGVTFAMTNKHRYWQSCWFFRNLSRGRYA